jgi:HK97 family phage portal protein
MIETLADLVLSRGGHDMLAPTEQRSGLATPAQWLVEWSGGRETASGIRVSRHEALYCTAVLACVRILSETVASLPLKVYKRLQNGGKEPAIGHPLYDVLWVSPNPEQTSMEWREQLMIDLPVHGDHFSQQLMNSKGYVAEMWRLDPSKMHVVRRAEDGPREYEYHRGNGSPRMFSEDEVLHVLLMQDGLRGKSLIDLSAETLGLTWRAQEFAARFFQNDATPRLVFEGPERMAPQHAADWLKSWNDQHKGASKAHGVGVVGGGLTAKLLQANLKDLQLEDVRKFQLEEVARVFRVPLHLIQSLDRSTNNNIEHQGIDFVKHTIRPWLVRIEQRIIKSLLGPTEAKRYTVEFDVDGLERGDFQSRSEGLARQVASALLTPNEGRALDNRPAIEGGDRLYIQGGMVPIEMAGVQPQQPQAPTEE